MSAIAIRKELIRNHDLDTSKIIAWSDSKKYAVAGVSADSLPAINGFEPVDID
jgi:hypothetical protein